MVKTVAVEAGLITKVLKIGVVRSEFGVEEAKQFTGQCADVLQHGVSVA